MTLPNILSITRLILSCLLFTLPFPSLLFTCLYCVCLISDFLDGFLARTLNQVSNIGQTLDSLADAVLILLIIVITISSHILSKNILIWIVLIFVINCISLFIGYLRYHTLTLLHTYANKVSGLLLYSFLLFPSQTMVLVICTLTTLTSIETVWINATSESLNRDVRWFRDLQ